MEFKQWLEQREIIPVQNADQKYDYDCGPAALRAIAKLFGHSKTQEDLIDMTDAGIKRKGSHPDDLVKAAYNAENGGYKMNSVQGFSVIT